MRCRFFAEQLRLSIGSKFEHNDYSGFEVEPNVRLLLAARTPAHALGGRHTRRADAIACRARSERDRPARPQDADLWPRHWQRRVCV